MALRKCSVCNNEISDMAVMCPYCRTVFNVEAEQLVNKKQSGNKWVSTSILTIIVVCVIACIFWSVSDNDMNKKTSGGNSSYDSGYTYTPKTGKEGALAQAQSYLRSQAFSYKGLIEQLEYHGYSSYEAKYGADNCGADWNAQAVKKAKSYLNSQAFSYNGLIDQLEYEGFSSSEAKYGVKNCGADWNEQAVKKAKSYLKSRSGWTRSELTDQLEYQGFTYSQASYGVENCGKSW